MALNAEFRGSDTYWKITKYSFAAKYGDLIYKASEQKRIAIEYLQECDIDVPSKTTLERLVNLISRSERGLLHYASHDAKVLKDFAAARLLERPKNGRLTTKALIGMLEQADDDARFTRMLELPAELRVRIYEYYCLDLGQCFAAGPGYVPFQHRQPPLTLVCRLIRQESLQVFYDTCTLLVDFERSAFLQRVTPPDQVRVQSHDVDAASAAANKFKRFHIGICEDEGRRSQVRSKWDIFDVLVDMPKAGSGVEDVSVKASWSEHQCVLTIDELWESSLAQAEDATLAAAKLVAMEAFEWCPEGFTKMARIYTRLLHPNSAMSI